MDGQTSTIRALARRLRERADEIRDLAARLTASAQGVDWQGVAADAMRAHVGDRVVALHRSARLHEDAADALDRHARAVDLATDLVEGPLHVLEDLL